MGAEMGLIARPLVKSGLEEKCRRVEVRKSNDVSLRIPLVSIYTGSSYKVEDTRLSP